MIREVLGHDDEKTMFRLTLRPREIVAATTATGLPEAAFEGTWDAWLFTAKPPAHWLLVEHRPSREDAALDWVQAHLDDLPGDWADPYERGGADWTDEFYVAGHLAARTEYGALYRDWYDDRGEHVGLICETCGYRQCSSCDRPDDVPDCDGPAGKVRRLNERWRASMAETDRLATDLWRAELAADPEGMKAKAKASRYDFYTPPSLADDVPRLAEMARQGEVLGLAMVVRTRNGVNLRRAGDIEGLAPALRRLSAEVEDAPRNDRVNWLEKRIWEALGELIDDPNDAVVLARMEAFKAELKPLVTAAWYDFACDPTKGYRGEP